MSIVYLNGDFIEEVDAKVSVLDRGFTFADGIYEVMPAYNRHIFRLKEHLKRLQNSLDAIHIKNPHSDEEWQTILETLVEKNEHRDQSLYLQVTRGISERDHGFSEDNQATVFALSRTLVKKETTNGVKAITHDDIRWKFCDIKSIALLPGVLLRYEAYKRDAYEAILIKDNYLTEGAASNVFIVKDGMIKTPKKDKRVLPGITRNLLVELLEKNSIEYKETDITKEELLKADEIWITSSTQEIVPVTVLDDKKVGSGDVGPVWHQINEIYQAFKRDFSGEDI